jgi:hypothetical protein
LLWDDDGFIYHDPLNVANQFIDNNPYAFGSYARREKAKEKHPSKTRTVMAFYPFKWQIKTTYEINLDGDVSRTRNSLKTLIKKKGYYQLWESPYKLFRRCVNEFKDNKKKYLEGDESVVSDLKDTLYPPKWDKRWGKRFASWWIGMFNKGIKRDMKP